MRPGTIVWFTGLPASGKTTAARQLVTALHARGQQAVLLDGDEVRAAMVPSPGYDPAARDGFYSTLANLAGLVAQQGVIAVVAATAHLRRWRDAARAGVAQFVEVYVATPADECRRRDPKFLYRQSDLHGALPGSGVPYEPPLRPDVVAPNGADPATTAAVLAALLPTA